MWLGLAAVLPGNIGSSKLMYPVIFWIIFSGSQPLWQNDTTIILQHTACTYTSVDFHPLLPIPSPNWCASPSTTTTAAVFHEGTYLCMHSSHRTGLGLNCSLVRLILKADSQSQMWETSIPMTTPPVYPDALWSPTSVPYPFYWFFPSFCFHPSAPKDALWLLLPTQSLGQLHATQALWHVPATLGSARWRNLVLWDGRCWARRGMQTASPNHVNVTGLCACYGIRAIRRYTPACAAARATVMVPESPLWPSVKEKCFSPHSSRTRDFPLHFNVCTFHTQPSLIFTAPTYSISHVIKPL